MKKLYTLQNNKKAKERRSDFPRIAKFSDCMVFDCKHMKILLLNKCFKDF